MQNESNLNFVVIIPCFNEEKHIGNCLDSILNQSLLPKKVMVVNDGSTDETETIVSSYQKKYTFIIQVQTQKKPSYEPGAKVVQAFKSGLKEIETNWDVVFKLDADVILPENYFKEVIFEYKNDVSLGMVGGLIYSYQNGKWQYENISDKNHLRGPIKSYRKDCYLKMNGLRESIGWDTMDEILCKFYGFGVLVREDLIVKVQKPTGTRYKKSHAKKMGLAMYKMRYGFVIAMIAAFKSSYQKKRISTFFPIIFSYLNAALKNSPKAVTKQEGKFIRQYRWRGIQQKIFPKTVKDS